jgi:tRNA dimethylallyltransferase
MAERRILYERIDRRCDAMIEQGLIAEVQTLLSKGFKPEANALRTIGYRDIIDYIQGQATLAQAIHTMKRRTRNFAKRQLTWFSKLPDVAWFNSGEPDLADLILQQI